MLISSEAFVRQFFWKYLDISINREEYLFVKESFPVDPHAERLTSRFADSFGTRRDRQNYAFVLSQLRGQVLHNFLVFYRTMVHKFGTDRPHTAIRIDPPTLDGLDRFVGEDGELFKILLVSAHYFL